MKKTDIRVLDHIFPIPKNEEFTNEDPVAKIVVPETVSTEKTFAVNAKPAAEHSTPANGTKVKRSKAAGTWGVYPKSISRIETEKHCAWYVRIYYEGVYVRKTFSDIAYNGKDDALREAINWRDEMEKRMGKPRTERSVRKKTVVDDRMIGVHRRQLQDKRNGRVYLRDVYEVTWSPKPGKVERTKVSVTKHGEEKALRMAQEIRRAKQERYFGSAVS